MWYCTGHHGAIHVCDMRCKFRDLAMSDTGAIAYRCRISGLVTSRRLLLPCATSTSAQVNKRGVDEDSVTTPKTAVQLDAGWARQRLG